MPAIGNLTINDGVPAAHTFNPVNIKNDVASFVDRSGGIAIGFPQVTASLRMPSGKSRVYRAKYKVVLPILEVTAPSTASGIQPAPTVAYELPFHGEFVIPERATLANRKDILAYAKNFMATSVVTAMIENLETIY